MKKNFIQILTSEKLNTKVLVITSGLMATVGAICALWNPILLVFAYSVG